MNREKALDALQQSFAESLGRKFGVLERGIMNSEKVDELTERFRAGLHELLEATSIAAAEVEKIFPE